MNYFPFHIGDYAAHTALQRSRHNQDCQPMITTRTRRTAPVVPTVDDAFWSLVQMASFATANKWTSYERLKRDWSRKHPSATQEEWDAATRRIADLLKI